MNPQFKVVDKVAIRTGIEWCSMFGPGSGFTANPIRGCAHLCQWRMPDGKIVKCYAKTQRDRMDGDGAFENITFHPDVFQKIARRKERAGIFIDSMSDLLGEGVNANWVEQTLSVMRECVQHIFFVLTKNPRRLSEFDWPKNALVGISAPPTFMYGKEMNVATQRTWFRKAIGLLAECSAKNVWLSLEPLAIDVSDMLEEYAPDWAVIGAGSDGAMKYQPDELIFQKTLRALHGVPVFFKGNIDKALAERNGGWREEFPQL